MIRDLGPWDSHFTVTNDAEWVVADLFRGLLTKGRRLFYYDSNVDLEEILVKDGRFVGFAPGPRHCLVQAHVLTRTIRCLSTAAGIAWAASQEKEA